MKVAVISAVQDFDTYYTRMGITRERFLESFMGQWDLQYACALRAFGISLVIYHFSSRTERVERCRHKPTGAEIVFIPLNYAARVAELMPKGRHVTGPFLSLCSSTFVRALRDDAPDLIWVQEYENQRYDAVSFIGQLLRIPVMATYHGGRVHLYVRPIKWLTLRLGVRFTCPNRTEFRRVVRTYPFLRGRVDLIPNFADTRFMRRAGRIESRRMLGLREEAILFLLVGRIYRVKGEYVKGLDYLFPAFARLYKEIDASQLVIVGDGPDMRDVQRQAASMPPGSVCLPGWVDNQETLRRYFSAADVYVMPSTHEAFGIAAVEAMACNVPVIGTRETGLAEVVADGETGWLVPRRNVDTLYERMRTLARDSGLRERMGAAARERAENLFSIQAVAGRFAESMKRAVEVGRERWS